MVKLTELKQTLIKKEGGYMPRNCNECEHFKSCEAYYGGAGCKHKKAIEAEKR